MIFAKFLRLFATKLRENTDSRSQLFSGGVGDVYDALSERIAVAEAAGIARDRIVVDPGIGFGKTMAHNLKILGDLGLFRGLGCPLLVGVSRKQFIACLSSGEMPEARMPGSVASALHAITHGAHIVRVHDVAETVQAIKVWQAVVQETMGSNLA